MSHFPPDEQSYSLPIGAPLAHQSGRVETHEFGMDLSRDASAMGAAGGGSTRIDGATEKSPYSMGLMPSTPRMPPTDAEQGSKRRRTSETKVVWKYRGSASQQSKSPRPITWVTCHVIEDWDLDAEPPIFPWQPSLFPWQQAPLPWQRGPDWQPF